MNNPENQPNTKNARKETECALAIVAANRDFKVLRRVPELRTLNMANSGSRLFTAAIIDLETLGLDPTLHPIIELGMLLFSFSSTEGILSVTDTYNGLQDPGVPIPEEITGITGITNDDVAGKTIDWSLVAQYLQRTDVVICHNAYFDRNHLEMQAPPFIQDIVKNMFFGCSLKDVDWRSRGYESNKLEFLNFKAGYFYEGHRALVDCWATLNILVVEEGAFDELKSSVKKRGVLICALNSSFDTKGLLKGRGYRWSDGTGTLPKAWWTTVDESVIDDEKSWLDEVIYKSQSASSALPNKIITARSRYSRRAETFD
mgnify:CR=1 FL=1